MTQYRISEGEWKVMNALWEEPGRSSNEVVEALSTETWSDRTIRTLINRLAAKNILRVDKTNLREHRFFPLHTERDCVQQETRSLFDKIRPQATRPALAAFIQEQDFTPEEIQELKDILEQKEQKGSKS
jgi:BlaI family penicillinase repressor